MKAYVTLLSTKSYLKGVIALNKALLAVHSKYPLYCILSKGVSQELESALVQNSIPSIRLTDEVVVSSANNSDAPMSHWNFTFDKLKIWGLTQFEKLVFIDSDMLVLQNLDSLFLKDEFSAVQAGMSFPGNESWDTLNSGIIVIRPDKKIESDLIDLAQRVVAEFREKNCSVGDQDVLHSYLPEWKNSSSLILDEGYNVFANYLTYYVRHLGYSLRIKKNRKPIYIVHFVGKVKPWMKKGLKEKMLLVVNCLRNPYYFIAYRQYSKYF